MRLFQKNPSVSDTTPAQSAATEVPLSGRVSILVVEDSPTQARLLQKLLEEQGYQTEVARDGKEALDYLNELRSDRGTWASFRPTMVISDIVMPHMEGSELCRHMKEDEDFKDIPVILLTSLTDAREALRGLYNGADNLISKPYEPSFLLARIEDMLATLQMSAGEPDKLFTLSMDGRKYSVSPNDCASSIRFSRSMKPPFAKPFSSKKRTAQSPSKTGNCRKPGAQSKNSGTERFGLESGFY